MYVPAHFAEHRPGELHRLMRDHPLGMLVTSGPAGLDANHIPFEFDAARGEHGTLRAHVARANPACDRSLDGSDVLVVFRGGEAYVSPNWYPGKHETHREVPTWDYMVVHAHGRLTIRDDETYVRALVARLTKTHEAQQPVPWKMSDAPRDFIDGMLEAIVGIEIEVGRLVGKSKLGQNKDLRDRLGAAEALERTGHTELAAEMRGAAASTEAGA
jgi:transcriptional regulator